MEGGLASGNRLGVIGYLSNSKQPEKKKITECNQSSPNNNRYRQRHETICLCDVVSV